MTVSPVTRGLWGRSENNLDDRGRFMIPERFRDALGKSVVLTMGPDNHVRVYSMSVWDKLMSPLITTDMRDDLNPDMAFLQRMYGNCDVTTADPQSRVSIARHLREWAELRESQPAIIIGCGNRIELWSLATWKPVTTKFTAERAYQASSRMYSTQPGPFGTVEPNPTAVVEARGDAVPTA